MRLCRCNSEGAKYTGLDDLFEGQTQMGSPEMVLIDKSMLESCRKTWVKIMMFVYVCIDEVTHEGSVTWNDVMNCR